VRSAASDQSSTAAEQANNRPVPRADLVLRIGQSSLRTLYGWPGRLQEKRTAHWPWAPLGRTIHRCDSEVADFCPDGSGHSERAGREHDFRPVDVEYRDRI
jgi:hypothetical protein